MKRLFQLKQKHKKWSLSRLVEALNEEGYQTTQGKAFTKVQVKQILYGENFIKLYTQLSQVETGRYALI